MWKVTGGEYGIHILRQPVLTITQTLPINWPANLNDYSIEFDMRMTDSIGYDRNFVFRYVDENKWYDLHIYGNGVYFQKYSDEIDSSEGLIGDLGITYPFQPNNVYHFKIKLVGNKTEVSIGNEVLMNVTDESSKPILHGRAGPQSGVGAYSSGDVSFDNILVKSIGEEGFDLPFNYEGRPTATDQQFKSAFWKRLTAAFDHVLRFGTFRPFTGQVFPLRNCLRGTSGISCYDSHNGTDFSKKGGKDVLSVSQGTVVFTSEHTRRNCTPNRGGFGCVVIVEYPDNIFGLYAHLNRISVNEGDSVNVNSVLGVMGNTGCPTCGVHLHFGVLNPVGLATSLEMKKGYIASRMTKNDWNNLLYQARPEQTPIPRYRPYCTYRAPNGQRFTFQDPSGWKGNDTDPWSKPTSGGGCGVESPYLWKFDVGTSL